MEDRVTLFQEYRLIEKSESEINAAWKGAHLLLFFLCFVFGSFCTFCFHVLMYLFDEKCVLFPKLISLKDLHGTGSSGIILEYISKKDYNELPVDFVTTQWMDDSMCYLPRYVPLLSGICGLVWTTMFLMCSSGSRSLTGLQRPWRIFPPVFIFSLGMGGLCFYTSLVTQLGLQELCSKLGEFTGSNTCTYTINVATLAYDRHIRGVYQAMQLTIASAWLHTLCWLSAALLALARVVLIVDFRLVRVRADLTGNVEQMLERHERHIRTDEFWSKDDKGLNTDETSDHAIQVFTGKRVYKSEPSLFPGEHSRVSATSLYKNTAREHKFIVRLLYIVLDEALMSSDPSCTCISKLTVLSDDSDNLTPLTRTKGQLVMRSPSAQFTPATPMGTKLAEQHATQFRQKMLHRVIEPSFIQSSDSLSENDSKINLTHEMYQQLSKSHRDKIIKMKPNMRTKTVQTDFTKAILQKLHLKTSRHSTTSVETLVPQKEDADKGVAEEYDKEGLHTLFDSGLFKAMKKKAVDAEAKTEKKETATDKKTEATTEIETEPRPSRLFFGGILRQVTRTLQTNQAIQTEELHAEASTGPPKPNVDKELQVNPRAKEKLD